MSLYALHLGQIISTVLEQIDHDGRHGNVARTPIWDETFETDHTQKRRFRHSAIYQTIKALAILRCFYGSEMVLLGVVLGKCEMPSTDISQENDHAILIVKRQFVAYNFK
jgi:stage V sporulation protein SpoVS